MDTLAHPTTTDLYPIDANAYVHVVAMPAALQRRHHVAESPALAAWRANLTVVAQIAKDNETRAVEAAKRDAGGASADELAYRLRECLYWRMGFRSYDHDGDEATFREYNRRRLDATDREIRRRLALLRDAVSSPDVVDRRPGRPDVVEVAQRVKEILTVPDVLVDLGYEPKRSGMSRGREEAHSSCPVCGGRDRFVSFANPDSRGFCRRCQLKGDVVDVTMGALNIDFAEATRRLARMAGIAA